MIPIKTLPFQGQALILVNKFISRVDSPWEARPQCWGWREEVPSRSATDDFQRVFTCGFWGHSTRKEEGCGSRVRRENRERHGQIRTRKSQGWVCRVRSQAWQPSRSTEATPLSQAGLASQGLPWVLPPLASAPASRDRTVGPHHMRPVLYSHTRNKPIQNTLQKLDLVLKSPLHPSPTHPRPPPGSPEQTQLFWASCRSFSRGSSALRAKVRVRCR